MGTKGTLFEYEAVVRYDKVNYSGCQSNRNERKIHTQSHGKGLSRRKRKHLKPSCCIGVANFKDKSIYQL